MIKPTEYQAIPETKPVTHTRYMSTTPFSNNTVLPTTITQIG